MLKEVKGQRVYNYNNRSPKTVYKGDIYGRSKFKSGGNRNRWSV